MEPMARIELATYWLRIGHYYSALQLHATK